MVTKADRVRAALANSILDRPPVSAWGHHFESEWHPKSLAETTVRLAREYDWDWVKLQNRETCFAEALGGAFAPDPSGKVSPLMTVQAVTKRDDWYAVIERANNPELAPSLVEQIDLLRMVIDGVGPDVPVLQTVFSPVSIINYLVGRDPERAVAIFAEDPELMAEVVSAISGMLGRFIRASLEAGAAGIYYAVVGYASERLTTEEYYRHYILPGDLSVVAHASDGWFNMVHLCSHHIHFSLFEEFPVQAISWANLDEGNPSLAEARATTTKALVGGLDRHDPIRRGSAAATFEAATSVLAENDLKGLLLSPGCSVTPWPWDHGGNFNALRWAAESQLA